MRYFKLLYDYNNDKALQCFAGDLYGIDRYSLENGIFVTAWDKRISFSYNNSSKGFITDYLGNDLGWLIVSKRFREALEKNNIEGIQYLPVSIINEETGCELPGYNVANINNLVDALDLSHCIYTQLKAGDETIIRIVKYALKRDNIDKHHIFRLKNHTNAIFISEYTFQVLKDVEITGCDFLEVKTH